MCIQSAGTTPSLGLTSTALATRAEPSAQSAIKSVNVPPVSMPSASEPVDDSFNPLKPDASLKSLAVYTRRIGGLQHGRLTPPPSPSAGWTPIRTGAGPPARLIGGRPCPYRGVRVCPGSCRGLFIQASEVRSCRQRRAAGGAAPVHRGCRGRARRGAPGRPGRVRDDADHRGR